MFLSLSKTLTKFGGFRFGVGMRLTKKNAWWMFFVLLFVYMFKAYWYMMIICLWLIYAICYGFYWCIKKLCQKIKLLLQKRINSIQ